MRGGGARRFFSFITFGHRTRCSSFDSAIALVKEAKKILNLPEQQSSHVQVMRKEELTPLEGGDVAYIDGKAQAPAGFESLNCSHSSEANLHRSLDSAADQQTYEPASKFMSEPIPKSTIFINSLRPILPVMPIRYYSTKRITDYDDQGLFGKHILSVEMFSKGYMDDVFDLAETFKTKIKEGCVLDDVLKGKVMASVFYEGSTKTMCSFAAGMQRLGGQVIYMDPKNSCVIKGETLEDSVAVLAGFADVVLLRHPEARAVDRVAQNCRKPVINAGDGAGEHPTQALVDIFTMREELDTINGITVTMVGDLKHGRTVHSLARLLTNFEVTLQYLSPENLDMPKEISEYVCSRGIDQKTLTCLEEALSNSNIIYMTRIQKERFESDEEYKKCCGQFIVTPELMIKADPSMRVMHPLPRIFEITKEFDTDPRAAYFRQAENALYIRMALLVLVLTKKNT